MALVEAVPTRQLWEFNTAARGHSPQVVQETAAELLRRTDLSPAAIARTTQEQTTAVELARHGLRAVRRRGRQRRGSV